MTVAMQIRDVPEDVRDVIAQRAAQQGQSVQAYLLALVVHEARVLHNGRAFERTAGRRVTIPSELDPDLIIREGRDRGLEVDRFHAGMCSPAAMTGWRRVTRRPRCCARSGGMSRSACSPPLT